MDVSKSAQITPFLFHAGSNSFYSMHFRSTSLPTASSSNVSSSTSHPTAEISRSVSNFSIPRHSRPHVLFQVNHYPTKLNNWVLESTRTTKPTATIDWRHEVNQNSTAQQIGSRQWEWLDRLNRSPIFVKENERGRVERRSASRVLHTSQAKASERATGDSTGFLLEASFPGIRLLEIAISFVFSRKIAISFVFSAWIDWGRLSVFTFQIRRILGLLEDSNPTWNTCWGKIGGFTWSFCFYF